jgi:4-carboxymuconolactone decarboxylase
MARLDYAESVSGDLDAAIRRRRGGTLRPLDRMLLHSPPIALAWNGYLEAVREHTTLVGALRELIILRVAALNDCAYEWDAHEPLGLAEGLSEADVSALRRTDAVAVLEGRMRTVCAFTDAVTRCVHVPDDVFADARRQFGDRDLVEIAATAATYNMVSRFLCALHVGDDAPREEMAGDA